MNGYECEPMMERAMPRYKCHKEVAALKIKAVYPPARSGDPQTESSPGYLEFEDDGYARRYLTDLYFEKHKPQAGGYFVVYEDGYESWSPAKAFEDGYTRI